VRILPGKGGRAATVVGEAIHGEERKVRGLAWHGTGSCPAPAGVRFFLRACDVGLCDVGVSPTGDGEMSMEKPNLVLLVGSKRIGKRAVCHARIIGSAAGKREIPTTDDADDGPTFGRHGADVGTSRYQLVGELKQVFFSPTTRTQRKFVR
jgi:hypothetical protein